MPNPAPTATNPPPPGAPHDRSGRSHADPRRPGPVPVRARGRRSDEDGSLITEYGLLAVVAAAIASVVISYASEGAIANLFNALISAARGHVSA
ncbi:hypothetical protein [Egicoccus sp. AB-alg6-2]|uniref:hypothetical protein n=1 Tax=Egicoccus sp. AB-alg6-2 TaxID=3242692 RepID=UPI00359CFCA7